LVGPDRQRNQLQSRLPGFPDASMLLRSLRSLLVALAIGLALSGPAAAASAPPVLLVFGDSISSGLGLAGGKGWVSLLAERLKSEGYRYTVVNGSISGDTTAGGRARLKDFLAQYKPQIVVLELGGNDALRGGNLTATRANLEAMVSAAQSAKAKVLLVGMQVPPNYGSTYAHGFEATFRDVAAAKHVPLVPAFFAGFGEDLSQFQSDRIHPNAGAQLRLLDNVWPFLLPLLHK
jgi:acyl-CoA thioesterase-1